VKTGCELSIRSACKDIEPLNEPSDATLRILLVADTHLGFDLPFRPRLDKRRRGPDFFANFERTLQPALDGKVHLVIHGGDLFFRSKVPQALIPIALEPLLRVAQTGVPVLIVPGNHERGHIPLHLWTAHPNLYIFDHPKTLQFDIAGNHVSFSGFPYTRQIRANFSKTLTLTGYRQVRADISLLCMHQVVEGAKVGPSDYTFRSNPDVIRSAEIPADFCAVLSGHIHRSQKLTHALDGRPLAAPVIYPGSVERTSFAERDEKKHYVILEVAPGATPGGRLVDVKFVPLPTRPMLQIDLPVQGMDAVQLERAIRKRLASLDPNAVVRIRPQGSLSQDAQKVLQAASLRKLAPTSMDVSIPWKINSGGVSRNSQDNAVK
jgi:exonuclease SbcD